MLMASATHVGRNVRAYILLFEGFLFILRHCFGHHNQCIFCFYFFLNMFSDFFALSMSYVLTMLVDLNTRRLGLEQLAADPVLYVAD